MLYTVETFYTDADGQRHLWAKPFAIAESEIVDFRETSRALIEALLDEGQRNDSHPIGLEIHDPDDQIIFAYLRPAPSQG